MIPLPDRKMNRMTMASLLCRRKSAKMLMVLIPITREKLYFFDHIDHLHRIEIVGQHVGE